MKIRNILLKSIILVLLTFIFTNIIPVSIYAAGIDGTTIVLNPGHGGWDTGCVNKSYGLFEKDLTLKITRYLEKELLKYYDVKVIVTHDGVNLPINDTGELAARAMIARNNKADLYASLHINDFSNHEKNGASVYVTSRTELPKYKEGMTKLGNMILDRICALGIRREGVYNNRLATTNGPAYKYYDGSPADYYADIRYAMRGDTKGDLGTDFRDGSGISTVLIEHCYMNNANDVQFLNSDEGLRKLAKADADAIVEYYKLRLKEDVVSKINVDKDSLNLLEGNTTQIVASVEPSTAVNKTIKWTSQDESIAKVDENGNVEAVGVGKTNIIVKSEDNHNIIKTIPVNVEREEVKFVNNSEYVLAGRNTVLNATISPTWITGKTIEWTSSAPEIISVTEDGVITAKKEGTAKISVIWKEKQLSDEITITVVELSPNTKIQVNEYKAENNILTNIGANVKLEDFIKNIEISDNLKVEIQKKTEDQQYIGTNTKVIIKEKEHDLEVSKYDCLIYADVNGDGKISTMDYTLIKNHIMEVKMITDENVILATDVSGDGKVSTMDYTLIKNHIMDVKKITKK